MGAQCLRDQVELRSRDPRHWGGDVVSGTWQDDERRTEFLEQHGFRPAEYAEVNMMRSLAGPIPPRGPCWLPAVKSAQWPAPARRRTALLPSARYGSHGPSGT
jgi:hypothetical protein